MTAWVGWTVTGSFRERNIIDHHHLPKLDAQWAEPVSLTFHSVLRKLYKTFHGASYQISVHLAKRFQRKIFFWKSTNQKQDLPVADMFAIGSGRNKNYL